LPRYGYFPPHMSMSPASSIRAYTSAGFDEVYVGSVGPETDGFFDFYGSQVLPRLREGDNR
jgi:hypothetical protein